MQLGAVVDVDVKDVAADELVIDTRAIAIAIATDAYVTDVDATGEPIEVVDDDEVSEEDGRTSY